MRFVNVAFVTIDSATLLYTYISRFPVNPHYQQREKIRQSCSHKFYPPTVSHCVFQLLAQTAHTPKQGPSGRGRYHYPRSVPHVHKHPRAGCQNGVLCRFGILARRCSRRTQKAFGTAMRSCASLLRGVAAPLGCVILLPLLVQPDLLGWKDLTKRSGRVTITRNDRTASRLALVQRLRWAVK